MRRILLLLGYFVNLLVIFAISWIINDSRDNVPVENIPKPLVTALRPLEKYNFESLMVKDVKPGKFTSGEIIKDEKDYNSKLFFLDFDPAQEGNNLKKMSGLLNLPKKEGKYPLVLMFRGYVDQNNYTSGMGSQKAGEYFVQNGFITASPDFLGYAQSDKESSNIFESRFQTYTTALTMLKSISTDSFAEATQGMWDGKNIFIWGHSNGGQVALTLLELTGANIPTVLWAPVSKPFPYSVLYYTDESQDHGKLIRSELAKFENNYDVEKYSLTNYLDKINTEIQIHQGTADDAVPLNWTDTLVKKLKKGESKVDYFTYIGSDHNLKPAWDTVVRRNVEFFRKNIN